jgi:hypothetical protein
LYETQQQTPGELFPHQSQKSLKKTYNIALPTRISTNPNDYNITTSPVFTTTLKYKTRPAGQNNNKLPYNNSNNIHIPKTVCAAQSTLSLKDHTTTTTTTQALTYRSLPSMSIPQTSKSEERPSPGNS